MQITDDRDPFLFLFYLAPTAKITFRSCTLHSPCGGCGPSCFMSRLQAWAGAGAKYTIQESAGTVTLEDTGDLTPLDTIGTGATVRFINTTLSCYGGTPTDPDYPFAAEEVPPTWLPGASEVAVRPEYCQRRESFGADYRGTVNNARGQPCQAWNETQPIVRFLARFPIGFSFRVFL
jgi:hypothetical protein